MKALALVIITVVLTRSHCRKSTTNTLVLQNHGIQLAMLPDQSQVKLDCGPVAVAAFRSQADLTSTEWSKDSIPITGNYTDWGVFVFNDNRELFIDGLTKAVGLDGNGTEGNYTCKVCLNQRCNESIIEVVTDPGTSRYSTRYVSIGAQAVVWLPEQAPVLLDCEKRAVAAFGSDILSRISVEWVRNGNPIESACTVRNVAVELHLLISALTIRTGPYDGTEGTFECRACLRNDESSPGSSKDCQIFHTKLIASSPPILECGKTSLVTASAFVNLDIGCDLCVQPGQSVDFFALDCTPDTRRQPTYCTIRNPDGVTAEELDDGAFIVAQGNQITIIGAIRNPEDPAPPTLLGVWTCTCFNENGVSTTISRIGECRVGLSFDPSQYSIMEVLDHYGNNTVTISLTANLTTGFPYIVEISVKDINTTAGLDYNVTSLNVTMRAGETRAMFSMGVIADSILERRESFQCTVSNIYTPSQDIPIEWDQVPVTVIIDEYLTFATTFLGNYSSVVSENVSHVPITIESIKIAAFEYTVDLYVDNDDTAKEGSDFVLPEVVFRPYQTSVTVNVLIIDDEISEEVEDFTIRGNIVAPDHGLVEVTGSVTIEIIDDDCCPEYFIFPCTTVGEVATIPCSTDGSGSGMYGNIETKCEGGVWGRVDMSQCTFRRDVPGHPILWMVELRSTNLTSLKQLISEFGQAQNVIVNKQGRLSSSDRSVYFIQAPNDDIVNSTRSVIGSKLIRESIVLRKNGCNCCETAKIDLFNSKSTYTEICEGESNIQVPCSCLNDENKCGAFYLDEDSKCYLDTDQDSKPDVNDSCIECCPEEFNIFLWPKRDYGITVERNCSEIHPSFGGSKVRRTCRQNDTWDPVDISSCTFKNGTGSTPIILFNATVNGSDINEARKILREQARNLVLGNTSFVNVTVTEVATVETTNSNQIVVIFVIEFTANTTLVENFPTAISIPSMSLKYVQAVIPAESCSCSSNGSDELRRLCIGTATAPCDCDQGANCKCVDPYLREQGGTCTLDTDGDKIADHEDMCPYEYGENCRPKEPLVSKCPQETDSTWKLFWRDAEHGDTLYTRCPRGVYVSAGLASRMCGADGTWGEVDTRNCISRAFLDIEQRMQNVKQVLKTNNALTNKQRAVITGITRDLSAALNVDNTHSVLPRDLTTTTNLVEELASLSENNGLFSGQNNTEQQMAVVGVISGVLDNRNVHAFKATSKEQETPAESLLESTELLTRTGFVQQDQSIPPPDAPFNKSEKVVVDTNLVVQSNRLNSLSFSSPSFNVSFPSREFDNDFAKAALIPTMVIPGGFLKALTTGGFDGGGTQAPVPADSTTTLLTPSAVSPTTSQTPPTTPPTVPTTDTNNQTVAKPVDVVSFTMNNLQKLLPLRLANEPDEPDGTRRIEPVSLIISSQVAGVENTAVDSGETISISFTLLENAQDITVGPHENKIHCAFWDFAGRNGSGEWSFDGIKKVFDNGTHVQCESKHLTSFVVLASSVSTKTSTPSPPDGEHVNSTNAGAIIAGSLAVLLVVISFTSILGVVLLKCWRKKKNKDAAFIMKRNQSLRAVYNRTEVVIHPGESATLGDWEMTHSHLEIQGDLGKGQFGDVKLAYLKTMTCTRRVRNYMDRMIELGNSMSTLNAVAVKYLKGTATSESKALFLEEIELMKKVSTTSNNHIVQLIGYILLEEPMAMVMEYVPFGDLHSNLIKWKEQIGESSMSSVQSNSDNTAGQNYLYSKETLKDQDIFSFAYQIAIGMKYLTSMNVIHRDLACRNVLVGENKTLKISDFGLSKEIDGVYASSSRTRLPLRWMAPEAIAHRLFSEKSDIWSYGVCLWEICTLGEVPYSHLPNADVARSIAQSILLEKPLACNDKIHELMLRCWREKASDRPTFTNIKTYLEGLIEKECGSMYIDIVLENDYEGENDDFKGEEMPQDVESI